MSFSIPVILKTIIAKNILHRITPYLLIFFWESNFKKIGKFPVCDKVFPKIGYTVLFNMGTPFRLITKGRLFHITKNVFYPRNKTIKSIHSAGNNIFGVDLFINPLLIKKDYDKSISPDRVMPADALVGKQLITDIIEAPSFADRIKIADQYLDDQLKKCMVRPELEFVCGIIKELREKAGIVPFSTITSNRSYSSKIIHRLFMEFTGSTLYDYWRILRFRKAMQCYLKNKSTEEADKTFYFDKTNFSDDVWEFTGSSIDNNLLASKSFL